MSLSHCRTCPAVAGLSYYRIKINAMNHKQQLFANAYLRLNDPLVAYIQAYNPKDASNYRSIKSAANRLLRNPEIAEHIRSVRDAARATAEYELKEQMKEELLSIHDKRLYIKRVINGEILIPQDYKTNGCNRCTIFLRPTFPQILGYLKEDSRLAGHYPEKRRTTTRQQRATSISCPPLPVPQNAGAGVSAAADGGGILAPESPEVEKEQQNATNCPPPAGVSHSDGGGTLAPDFPEEQNRQQKTTTTDFRLLSEELVAILEKDMKMTTTGHSELIAITDTT